MATSPFDAVTAPPAVPGRDAAQESCFTISAYYETLSDCVDAEFEVHVQGKPRPNRADFEARRAA